MNKLGSVTIKSITDDTVTVAGYGVVFGGVDLEGESFSPDTDFMLDLVPNKPVLYEHGMREPMGKAIIGKVPMGSIKADDVGLWVEAELDRHGEYIDYVLKLIEKGALGWSSGSVGQLALVDNGSIKRWGLVEFSLTPVPAEPRTLGVSELKALANMVPALKALADEEQEDEPNEVLTADEADDIEPESAHGEAVIPEGTRSVPDTAPEAKTGTIDDTRAKALRIEFEMYTLLRRHDHE